MINLKITNSNNVNVNFVLHPSEIYNALLWPPPLQLVRLCLQSYTYTVITCFFFNNANYLISLPNSLFKVDNLHVVYKYAKSKHSQGQG